MKGLMDGSHDLSQHFKNIRSYNSALSFASTGAQVVPPAGRGAYCFRIHGQIYHRTSHLHTAQAGEEKFAQLHVLDSELATCRRMERCENFECNPELMRSIDEVIRRVNPFAAAYIMMWELEQQVLHEEGHEASENDTIYISDERLVSD
ncbi:helitron_like_N domain-containing protein [Trichonephila inaurata madagascariensis]|uniref:Helitron_like_N domain-containing protein n=1 Tax=Trichonephila inaurata madagascariensis TaxID=2747483 RepID=A0A8X6MK18_9ARAC|nr:helitron_like_N domain-containing protein [Trichonephila inaurata madagascariensis]